MYQYKDLEMTASAEGIDYFVVCEENENPRPFGIFAAMQNDPKDSGCAENLFFTHEEACKCCLWLAENQVFPITLCEVLENFYKF